jgi:hypothetical protein
MTLILSYASLPHIWYFMQIVFVEMVGRVSLPFCLGWAPNTILQISTICITSNQATCLAIQEFLIKEEQKW